MRQLVTSQNFGFVRVHEPQFVRLAALAERYCSPL